MSNPFIQLNINIYILCISSTSPQAIPTPSLPGSHFVDRAKALRIRFARCILPHVQRKENGDFRNGGRFPRIFPLWCGILNARIFPTFHWFRVSMVFVGISMVKSQPIEIQQKPSRCDCQQGKVAFSFARPGRNFWPKSVLARSSCWKNTQMFCLWRWGICDSKYSKISWKGVCAWLELCGEDVSQ